MDFKEKYWDICIVDTYNTSSRRKDPPKKHGPPHYLEFSLSQFTRAHCTLTPEMIRHRKSKFPILVRSKLTPETE